MAQAGPERSDRAVSRRAHSSISRASAWPTTLPAAARPFSAAAGAATTTTPGSSPTAWSVRRRTDVSLEPGNVGGAPLFAKHSSIRSISPAQALSPAAVDSKDDKQPYTDSYSFTISRRLPWSSLLEVAYVGNQTRDIPSTGNGGSAGFSTKNINLVPVGVHAVEQEWRSGSGHA